ncbi:MAG: hypothetical protein ACW991_04945 [Candidatus Hodarchaeales archaeon]|jgi:hypothetical protein
MNAEKEYENELYKIRHTLATHTGNIGLFPDLKDMRERIYSGKHFREIVVLTIRLHSPPGQVEGTVEILVNGNPIEDGIIVKKAMESRTYKLKAVQTIDIVLKTKENPISGEYMISIPL